MLCCDATSKYGVKEFILEPGSNYIRLLTQPYMYNYHNHYLNGKFYNKIVCFPHPYYNRCILCLDKENLNMNPNKAWKIGLMSKKDNNKYLLDLDSKIFSQIKKFAIDPNWGDPTKYTIDLILKDNECTVNSYKDEKDALPKKDIELNKACLYAVDAIDIVLSNLKSSKDFSNFYLSLPKDLLSSLTNIVNEKYNQYSDQLKTLLIFS